MRTGDRRGFVLLLVVTLLFAIAVAGATGFIIVSTEFRMARFSEQGEEALAVARAGLHRFVAEQIGAVGDSVSYAIGDGVVLVTTRRVATAVGDSLTDVYLIRSEGSVSDPRTPGAPASRVVAAFARHHRRPIKHQAAAMIYVPIIDPLSGADIRGADANSASDCPGGGASTITGAIARNLVRNTGSQVTGSPNSRIWSFSQIYDTTGIRWDVLTDPEFPFEFDGSPPDFSSLPADSFPIVRYQGSLYATNAWDGRGVLIVTDQFDSSSGFDWDGIILAGWVDDRIEGEINGMLIGGLSGFIAYFVTEVDADIRYYSCNVYAANEALSYLELIDGTLADIR